MDLKLSPRRFQRKSILARTQKTDPSHQGELSLKFYINTLAKSRPVLNSTNFKTSYYPNSDSISLNPYYPASGLAIKSMNLASSETKKTSLNLHLSTSSFRKTLTPCPTIEIKKHPVNLPSSRTNTLTPCLQIKKNKQKLRAKNNTLKKPPILRRQTQDNFHIMGWEIPDN